MEQISHLLRGGEGVVDSFSCCLELNGRKISMDTSDDYLFSLYIKHNCGSTFFIGYVENKLCESK